MDIYILLLLAVPVVFSILFLFSRNQKYYKLLASLLFVSGTVISVLLAIEGPQRIAVTGTLFHVMEGVILTGEVLVLLFLYYVSIKHKRWSVLVLALISTALSAYTIMYGAKVEDVFFNVDKLSIVMALIVNIIGTLIVVFSNDYIAQYEHHRHMKSRQKFYYFVICIFLSAMNGLVFSDSLQWIYFFWEITTVASFLLISFNNDEEALNSGFRALFLNVIGGISFSIGIIMFSKHGIDSLTGIISSGDTKYVIPVFLLCIAGFVKSAQVPFQSWLLGAMVAPTPVSALLHSSTMVKAGVFLIIKLSPAFAGTNLGVSIALYGGFTFLVCSILATQQRNAKRILAYSTIANLGLIVCCAGMGSSIAISAGIALLIFHAISKALLFLCAGQIEHTIDSRDIEDMAGLIAKAPWLALLTAFGMLSMLLPPFGVLVTKWVSLEAASSNPLLIILLAIGSAFTTVYYVKWLGTVLAAPVADVKRKGKADWTTSVSLGLLGFMILAATLLVSPIFDYFVNPEVTSLMNSNQLGVTSDLGNVTTAIGSFDTLIVFITLGVLLVVIALFRNKFFNPTLKRVYMCGENNSESDISMEFRFGGEQRAVANIGNIYLTRMLDENTITKVGYVVSIAMLVGVLVGGLI
jgi:ech hydrogenase subunit A